MQKLDKSLKSYDDSKLQGLFCKTAGLRLTVDSVCWCGDDEALTGRWPYGWLRILTKMKLLGWKNNLHESCREFRALSNYHNYNISGLIDWPQNANYLSDPKLQTRISPRSLDQKRWGLGQKKDLDQGNNFRNYAPKVWDCFLLRKSSNTICIVQKIPYVKTKSVQQQSCR